MVRAEVSDQAIRVSAAPVLQFIWGWADGLPRRRVTWLPPDGQIRDYRRETRFLDKRR
ncbi:MAG: hypothetical protein F6K42_27365 [Leptolyngbya sp. SIO1D8]|nr:hypothetical protein [Leptolyngbya sp. SIO1D8]